MRDGLLRLGQRVVEPNRHAEESREIEVRAAVLRPRRHRRPRDPQRVAVAFGAAQRGEVRAVSGAGLPARANETSPKNMTSAIPPACGSPWTSAVSSTRIETLVAALEAPAAGLIP